MNETRLPCTYVLPLRSERALSSGELTGYLAWVAARAETIVVDGSPTAVFEEHARAWGAFVRHVAPAAGLATAMGKVGGVLTGVRMASHECLIIADDDVRYDAAALSRVVAELEDADIVRPQNFFDPLPWHAAWDTGRTLLNRISGGDWPGTLGVRRSVIEATGGYDGRAMFENLELVRTVRAAGGREAVPLDLYVARRPSSSSHFWSQRIRQAYDELARPLRLGTQLALLPTAVAIGALGGAGWLLATVACVVLGAESGRRRAGGRRVFPTATSFYAPLWLAERAVCSWLALGMRAYQGGVTYRGRVLSHAATPMRTLRARHADVRLARESPRRSA